MELIRESIARTLFLMAYADAAEEPGRRLPRARSGEDWNDVAPRTPASAFACADKLLARIAEKRPSIAVDCARWCASTGLDENRFGHCVAMMALGAGVGLFDDLPFEDEAALRPLADAIPRGYGVTYYRRRVDIM